MPEKNLIVIVGLPGSGKSHLALATIDGQAASPEWDTDAIIIDDPYPHNTHEFEWALASPIQDVIVVDPTACYTTPDRIEAVGKAHGREVFFVVFENDPDQCWKNLQERGDNKISLSALREMSKAYDYNVYERLFSAVTIGVYRKPE